MDYLGGAIITGLVSGVLCWEIYVWLPRLCAWLTSRIARALPANKRERYEEEWLAFIDDMPTSLAKAVSVAGFFWVMLRAQWQKVLSWAIGKALCLLVVAMVKFMKLAIVMDRRQFSRKSRKYKWHQEVVESSSPLSSLSKRWSERQCRKLDAWFDRREDAWKQVTAEMKSFEATLERMASSGQRDD